MQTAVEQLMIALYEGGYLKGNGNEMDDILEKYKQVFKQQIEKTFDDAVESEILGKKITAEQYYNETFKKQTMTAVEWFANEIEKLLSDFIGVWQEEFQQAKQMEKEQLHKCASFWRGKENEIEKPIFQQYYKDGSESKSPKETTSNLPNVNPDEFIPSSPQFVRQTII